MVVEVWDGREKFRKVTNRLSRAPSLSSGGPERRLFILMEDLYKPLFLSPSLLSFNFDLERRTDTFHWPQLNGNRDSTESNFHSDTSLLLASLFISSIEFKLGYFVFVSRVWLSVLWWEREISRQPGQGLLVENDVLWRLTVSYATNATIRFLSVHLVVRFLFSILGIRSGACTQLSLSLYTCRACWKRTRLDRTSPCGTTLWIDFGIWTIWHYVIWWASTLSLESIVDVDG